MDWIWKDSKLPNAESSDTNAMRSLKLTRHKVVESFVKID